jgi:hypothetical protein
MAWYVFALVEDVPDRGLGRGLSGPLRLRSAGGAVAIVERRADVPPPEFGSLRAHQAVVTRVAGLVPAILPVRFGTLLEDDALDEALEGRGDEIRDALAGVRHRVQYTWRRPLRPGRTQPRMATATPTAAMASGAAYLRHAAQLASPAPPAAFRLLRDRTRSCVVRERFQPASGEMPDTLYQLIEKTAEKRYRAMADAVMLTNPSLTMTGPWPPFAFAPETL